jgi:hypothetical protein
MKAQRTTSPSAAAPVVALPFAKALAELEPKIVELRAARDAITAKMLAHPDNNNFTTRPGPEPKDDGQAAALDLLHATMNGSAASLAKRKTRERYADLNDKRDTHDRAIDIAQKLYAELDIKARAELGDVRRGEFNALLKQKAQALIGLERIEHAIEKIVKGTDLKPYTLRGSSRLRVTGSPLYTFLDWCAHTGIISQKEFDDELKRARGDE